MFGLTALISATEISKSNFSSVTDGYMNALVLFYSPYCSHCIEYKPEWYKFTKDYENELGMFLGEINCVAEAKLCSDFNINGYPTVKYLNLRNKYNKEVSRPSQGDKTEHFLHGAFDGQAFEYKSFTYIQQNIIPKHNTFVLKYKTKDFAYQNFLTATDSFKSAKSMFTIVHDNELSLEYHGKENSTKRVYDGDFSMNGISSFIRNLVQRTIPSIDFRIMKENSELIAFLYNNQTTRQYYNNISLRLPPVPTQAIAEFPCLYKPFKSLKYTDVPCIAYVRTKTGDISLYPGNQSDIDAIVKWINAQSSKIQFDNKPMFIFCLMAIGFVVTVTLLASYSCNKPIDDNVEFLQDITIESL